MAKLQADGRYTFESISLQLAMAFGQGAGSTLATTDAIVSAVDAYRRELTARVHDWDALAPTVLEWARVAGRLSASNAASDGRAAISVADVKSALENIRSLTGRRAPHGVMAPCPLTIPKRGSRYQ
jgi:hypothetical protein